MFSRRALAIAVAAAGLVLVWDLARSPEEQWSAAVLVGVIELYQQILSTVLGAAGVTCRFEPTCSHYAAAVIRREGALGGSWRALRRLSRCGPWTPSGTLDPP